MRMTYSGVRFRTVSGLHTLWTPCTVGYPPSHLGQGFDSVPHGVAGRECVEVNVSKQRKFVGRAVRLAAVSGIAFGVFAPTAAHATCYPDACVSGTTTGDPGANVQGTTTAKTSSLPFTGGDVTGLALIGVGAVGAGAVFVRQSRRKVVA